MVETDEIMLETRSEGKSGRRGTSVSSATSVVQNRLLCVDRRSLFVARKSAESEQSVDAFVSLSLRGENRLGYRVTESYPLGGNPDNGSNVVDIGTGSIAAGTTNYIYYNTSWSRRAGISSSDLGATCPAMAALGIVRARCRIALQEKLAYTGALNWSIVTAAVPHWLRQLWGISIAFALLSGIFIFVRTFLDPSWIGVAAVQEFMMPAALAYCIGSAVCVRAAIGMSRR